MAGAPVLVTGGAGFLGARLVRRLVDLGRNVHVVARASTDLWRIGDLRDRISLHPADLAHLPDVIATIGAIRPGTVFHTAATGSYRSVDDAGLFRDNVLATFNVLQATAPLERCRVIHTASSLETGIRPEPIHETDACEPATAYAAAKAAATLLALQAAGSGRAVVVLRPFAIYGPGEPEHRLIPTAIRAAFTGAPLRLTSGTYTRDLVFVDDVVDAYVAASTTADIDGEVINVGTGRPTANHVTIRTIERLAGRSIALAPDPYPARATDRPFWCADAHKAYRLLGWRARHDVEQGLAKTIAAYRVADRA